MKRYLISPFSEHRLSEIRKYYRNWDYPMLRDVESNLVAYKKFQASSVDTFYVFAKRLGSPDEFGAIVSPNVYVTKAGAYYWNGESENFERFEDGSEILFPRIEGVEKEYLAFFKSYLAAAFGIKVLFAYDFRLDFFGTKRFSSYWGKVSGCDVHVPKMALPLITKDSDPRLFRDFLKSEYGVGRNVVLKIDGYSGGKGILAFDLWDPKDSNNLLVAVSQLYEGGKKSFAAFELLDALDCEIRVLWTKSEEGVKIVGMYKRRRLPKHVVHVPGEGGEIAPLEPREIPKGLTVAVQTFCSVIIDNHGGLDVIVTKQGKFYFIENNVLTGYLNETGERQFLKTWLDAVSDSYA